MTEAQEAIDTNISLTRSTAKSLLCSAQPSVFKTAEDDRTWSRAWIPALRALFPGSVLDQLWDSVLLRTSDARSGSQPNAQHRMLARAARMALDTEKARRDTLTTHADHGIWEDTPYISFTKSPEALQSLAESRMNRNRGDQRIVVVDPRIRLEIGLPVLHYKEEMAYYEIQSRYERDYWDGHYLCLWEVTPEEVVGVWEWDDLRSELNWFEEIIMPAVEEHREERDRRKAEDFPHQPDHSEVEDGGGYNMDNKVRLDNPDTFDETDDDETDDDADDDAHWSESEDNDERVCNENWTGELMKMYEDLRVD